MAIVIAVLLAISRQLLVDGCSMPEGWRPKSDVEKILDASDVLYGQVREVYPDMRFDYGSGTTAYTAELEVFCVLKGPPTNPVLNISEAGIIPGLCHSTNLTVGGRYVLIIRHEEETGEYSSRSVEIDASTPAALNRIMSACDLHPVYPKGVEASSVTVQCPTPLPPGQCKSKRDFDKSSDGSSDSVESANSENRPAVVEVRASSAAVSPMFDVPLSVTMTSVMAAYVILKLLATTC